MFFCTVKRILLLLLILPIVSFSQMLDNRKGYAFTDLPYFNQKFIQSNRIKTVKGHFQYKKTGEGIKNSNFIYRYNFDRDGRLIFSMETRLMGSIVDTTVLYYEYNINNRLAVLRQKQKDGFFTTKYDYDDNNRVIKESYYRDIDTTQPNIFQPNFESSIFISSQRYEYKYEGNTLKKTYYNNYDIPYQIEYITNNSIGVIARSEKVIQTTSKRILTSYEYDENGWISKITETNSYDPNYKKERIFHYDSKGNLIDEQLYMNGKHIDDTQVIYNKITGFLSYTFTRDIESSLITILKIDRTEFY